MSAARKVGSYPSANDLTCNFGTDNTSAHRQNDFAKFLTGAPIWITTHSETILQHFNNMIKLNNRTSEVRSELLEKFSYTNDDLLNPEEINLYQFDRSEKQTIIKKIRIEQIRFCRTFF